MAETRLTRGDITRLASRLEQPDPVLNASDRAVLRTVFDLAASTVSASASDAGSGAPQISGPSNPRSAIPNPQSRGDLPPLSEGFKDAYQPGTAARFTLENRTPADSASNGPTLKVRLV